MVHLFCLSYCFLSRINEDLELCRISWNTHKLSTEHNKTPNQILYFDRENSASIQINPYTVNEDYDDDDDDLSNISQVVVDEVKCPLSEELHSIFIQYVQPLKLCHHKSNEFWPYLVAAIEYCKQLMN